MKHDWTDGYVRLTCLGMKHDWTEVNVGANSSAAYVIVVLPVLTCIFRLLNEYFRKPALYSMYIILKTISTH